MTSIKYLDLAGEPNLWNVSVTVIAMVVGVFGVILKGIERGLEEMEIRARIETNQKTAMLKTARILRRVLEI